MTPHNHSTFVEGCYRCDIGRDEMADASLPDRVEAAARAIYDVDYADPELVQYAWHVLDDVRQGTYRDMAVAALAAADACEASRTSDDGHEAEASMSDNRIAAEAERNPNTTDATRILNRVEAAVRMSYPDDMTPSAKRMFYLILDDERSRRPVSSEDVHREAAEWAG